MEKCEGADISIDEELMFVSIYSDINDAEGIIFESWKGTEYAYRANGQELSDRARLGGRPIGFRVKLGLGGTDN